MAEIEIYSASACPFAQRTRLTLLEKQVDFELVEIDLARKPSWFTEISPYGKVPAIKHGDTQVWESAIINEYLEEVFPRPPLLPQDPGQRAIARIWIDFANTKFVTAFYKLLLIQEPQAQQEWAQELQDHLRFMESGISKLLSGPYWLGELSLVDLTFYPWFERWSMLEHYRGLSLPLECVYLRRWVETMRSREAVQAIEQSQDFYIQKYANYVKGTASGTTAREMRRA